MIHVTLLSKALSVGAYLRKCELIAAHADIALTVLVPPSWGNAKPEKLLPQGYALRVIPIRLNGNFHLHHYPTLRAELARSKPNVLHIDEEPYNLATFLALLAFRAFHASLGNLTPPKCLFFSWQNLVRHYPFPFRWMEQFVLKHAAGAVVGNREAQQVWRGKGFAGPIQVIPQFGVDEQFFIPAPKTSDNAPFTIGYAGRLVSEKRVDLLIQALPALPAAHLLIVGSGPEEARLRTQASGLGVAERVEFRAHVPSIDMPTIYRSMHVLVLPSETRPNWKEQFGRVLIEAMACGVPVIGSNSGEIPQVIGDAGLIFPEGNDARLTDMLMLLQRDPARYKDLAQRGRARVLQHFTMQRVADATVDFYRKLSPQGPDVLR